MVPLWYRICVNGITMVPYMCQWYHYGTVYVSMIPKSVNGTSGSTTVIPYMVPKSVNGTVVILLLWYYRTYVNGTIYAVPQWYYHSYRKVSMVPVLVPLCNGIYVSSTRKLSIIPVVVPLWYLAWVSGTVHV